jgi:cell division septation protein DedD
MAPCYHPIERMADDNVREIQLGVKQLFFLFMTAVVLAVVVFLLGVSVGRGVRPTGPADATTASAEAATEPVRPGTMPPATQTSPKDQAYTDRLQGTTPAQAKPADPLPAPPQTPKPAAAPPVQPPATGAAKPAVPQTETQKPAPPPAKPAPPTAAPAQPPAGEGWILQVGAFGSRPNAEKLATQLKGKGYAAFVVGPGADKSVRVRIGPFATRAEADRVAAKFEREEGTKPLVTR